MGPSSRQPSDLPQLVKKFPSAVAVSPLFRERVSSTVFHAQLPYFMWSSSGPSGSDSILAGTGFLFFSCKPLLNSSRVLCGGTLRFCTARPSLLSRWQLSFWAESRSSSNSPHRALLQTGLRLSVFFFFSLTVWVALHAIYLTSQPRCSTPAHTLTTIGRWTGWP